MKMTNGIGKELFRKSIHLCGALIPTFLAFFYVPTLIALVLIAVIYTVSEIFRLHGIRIPVIAHVTEFAARKRDENKFVAGPVTLVVGILAVAVFFEPTAARIGIYALAFGDGLASLAGKLFGHTRIPFTHGKTVAGSLTCFIAVFVSSFLVCKNFIQALILGAVAMLIEVIPLADFDNVVIPIAIAAVVQFAF